jgi:hypothetical protein
MVSSGMLRRVALVRTDVSEEPSTSFIRMIRIGELGITQAATSNRVAACVVPSSPILMGTSVKSQYVYNFIPDGVKRN